MSDALAAFRWRDALDILLVAIVIYRVFVMFRGTRAVQMMIGISALATASLLARQLELYSTEWLLDNLWSFWVIALVVLFQPELRRALASLGQGRVGQALLRAAGEEGAQVLDEIGSAVESLSARRIGALLVVERATGLRQYAELGVPLDARVSADLLVSVFLPYSPLHDGAVFIQGTRIAAAGCFLPLSRNLQVGRALGTRHRAALGITEETDAIAIVVSEESGRISLAVEGQMESPVEAGSLRQRFLTLAGGTPAPAGRPSFWLALRRLLPLPGKHA
ncbi:MAG: TIGR00159 family protein [Candidatus Rokuibacteriota bacterium]|nr:MAG: TIGR00159 family protein [Candidatus Rokubacteria bacterium 13_2_20CM_2_70_11]PYN32750.1 MAG: TIGR00159 family protein [Candidatus Rokubacteria bacterium]